jgi:VanZ family protein
MTDSQDCNNPSAPINVTVICLALIYCLAAFYPFQFALPEYANNGARWLQDGSLGFDSPGIATDADQQPLFANESPTAAVRVTIEARAAKTIQTGPARIVSFSNDPYFRNMMIAQDQSNLVVRIRRKDSNLNGIPEFTIPKVFTNPGWRHIEVHILPDAIEIRVDDQTVLTEKYEKQAFERWNLTYAWVFGNEGTGDRPWEGTIRAATLCFDSHCIEPLHPDKLKVAEGYWIGNWNTLINTRLLTSTTLIDVAINFLGFVPFGIIVTRRHRSTATLGKVLIAAATLSICMELGQIFFSGRFTSIIDVFFNTTGALLGFLIANRLYRKNKASSPDPSII